MAALTPFLAFDNAAVLHSRSTCIRVDAMSLNRVCPQPLASCLLTLGPVIAAAIMHIIIRIWTQYSFANNLPLWERTPQRMC